MNTAKSLRYSAELNATFAHSTPNLIADPNRPRMGLQKFVSDFLILRHRAVLLCQSFGYFLEKERFTSSLVDGFSKIWSIRLLTQIRCTPTQSFVEI